MFRLSIRHVWVRFSTVIPTIAQMSSKSSNTWSYQTALLLSTSWMYHSRAFSLACSPSSWTLYTVVLMVRAMVVSPSFVSIRSSARREVYDRPLWNVCSGTAGLVLGGDPGLSAVSGRVYSASDIGPDFITE